jgi:triosephosphate isomerase
VNNRVPTIGGNWKMNTDLGTARRLAREVAAGVAPFPGVEVSVFPPFPYLIPVAQVLADANSALRLGAQDLYPKPDGAYTGEVSIAMLKDCGVQVVLTGHSERRHILGESDELVNAKTSAVLEAGLSCILCIGETLAQRQAGMADEVNCGQLRAALRGIPADALSRLTIAYEPVWAIGTGKTATPAEAQAATAQVRSLLAGLFSPAVAAATRIQYGGSAKASNVAEFLSKPDIDGGLAGGASLDAAQFIEIVRATDRAKLHP